MKYKKKEIIIIIFIIGITLGLALIPNITKLFQSNKENISTEDEDVLSRKRYVTLYISGELLIEELVLKIPYGYSYGNIIKMLEPYTNEFSVIDYDSTQVFYEDTRIDILSKDDLKEQTSNEKIKINEASKNELVQLYGIGEKRADKIIEYRKTKVINSFEELRSLIGVSVDVLEKIKTKAIL